METRPEVMAFLEDIKENPEDDTPRLILADWLEERDDPRGTLIRVQCALTHTQRWDPGREDLKRQQEMVLHEVQQRWPDPLASLVVQYDYQRGLQWVTCEAGRFIRADVGELVTSEPWAWVEGLILLKVQPPLQERVLSSPLLGSILTLSLYNNHLGEGGATLLAGAPSLRTLTTLRLGGCRIGPTGMYALAESRVFPRLRVLYLWNNEIGDFGAEVLALSETLSGLTHLGLPANQITDQGARFLARSSHFQQLSWLDLRDNRIGEQGLALLRERFGDKLYLGAGSTGAAGRQSRR